MKYPTCLLSVTKDIGGIKSLSDVFVALQLSFGSVGDAIAKMAAAASSGAGVFGTLSAGAAALSGTLVPIVAIAAAVAAGIYAISKAYVSASEANDKMRDSYSAYQEAQSNLESVNSELDTTKASMDELLGKEHLTFVEEAELQKLKDATEQLLIQQDLAEREENKAARQAAEDTVSAYKKNFKNEISASQTKERQDYAQMTGNNAGLTVEPTDVSSMLAAIKQFDALKQEAKDELAKAQKDGNENDIKWLEEDIQHYDDLNQDLTDSIWDQVKLLTEYRDTLKALPEEELAKVDGASDVLSQIDDQIAYIYSELDPTAWKQMQFNEILNSDEYKKAKDELTELAKATDGAGISVDDVKEKYPELASAIEGAGLSISDFVDLINSSAEATDDAGEAVVSNAERIQNAVDDTTKATQELTSQIDAVQSVLNGQMTGKSISVEDFNSDELADYRSALEYVNGTMQLNADKVAEIAKAKADEQVAINNTNKALAQSQYLENARQIEQYRQQLRDASFAEGETADSIQASIDALLDENSANNFLLVKEQDVEESPVPIVTLDGVHIITHDQLYLVKGNATFSPLLVNFEVGNWVHIEIDGVVYKLRLTSYKIDYDNLDKLDVEFSDVTYGLDYMSDTQSILAQAQSMATSYSMVQHQANKGNNANKQIMDMVENGLNLTNKRIVNAADNQNMVVDESGLLMREKNEFGDDYSAEQTKIINHGFYYTNDGWKTVKTGLGKYIYYDPETGTYKEDYGIIAHKIVGNIILGNELGIYNTSGSVKIDQNGMTITADASDTNKDLFTLQRKNKDGSYTKYVYVDDDGNIKINGRHIQMTTSDDLGSYIDKTIKQEAAALVVQLTNEYIGITTDSNGNGGNFTDCYTDVLVFSGSTDITKSSDLKWTITATSGIVGEWDKTNHRYTIKNLTTSVGEVVFDLIYMDKLSVSKKFRIAKLKAGADGGQGLPGRDGVDGKSSYIHIKYSPVANPTDELMTEVPSTYIGICVDENVNDPTTASSYTWSNLISASIGTKLTVSMNVYSRQNTTINVCLANANGVMQTTDMQQIQLSSGWNKVYTVLTLEDTEFELVTDARYNFATSSGQLLTTGNVGNLSNVLRITDNMNGNDYYAIDYIQLEKGNRPTDYYPAPEDLLNYTDKNLGDISDELREIISDVLNQVTINRKDFDDLVGEDGRIEEIRKSSVTTQQQVDRVQTDINTYIVQVDAINGKIVDIEKTTECFSMEDAGLRITRKISSQDVSKQLSMLLSEQKLSFYQGTDEVAYFSNNKLYVTDAEILERLQLGKFAFIPRSNGNLSFRYLGGAGN